jgi:hypothetical protein
MIAQYPAEIGVDPTILAGYEGIYQMTPKFALAVRADSGRLFVRATRAESISTVRACLEPRCNARRVGMLHKGSHREILSDRMRDSCRTPMTP